MDTSCSEWREPPDTGGASAQKIDLESFRVKHERTLALDDAGIRNLRPPVVIEGFLRRGGVMLLGAESKSRKSWLAQDAAMSVATGGAWLADEEGEHGFATVKARCFIFDLELDEGEIAYRFAQTRGRRFTAEADRREVTRNVRHYCLDGLGLEAALAVIEACLPLVRPGDIVVVDCLYRLCPDSNDPLAVAMLFERVKHMAKATQAGWILVDHFRKAGADKARDRFNGSFVKAASAGTLVAIEARAEGVLELQIDARSFYGEPKVWCQWDEFEYRFVRVSEEKMRAAKDGAKLAEMVSWLVALWARDTTAVVTAKEAAAVWALSPQGARDRLKTLRKNEFVKFLKVSPFEAVLEERGRRHLEDLPK